MTASASDIRGWIERGIAEGARYLIVACDTFDHDNYPVYAKTDEECLREYDARRGQNMQTVDEVYDLTGDIETQFKQRRAFSLPARPASNSTGSPNEPSST